MSLAVPYVHPMTYEKYRAGAIAAHRQTGIPLPEVQAPVPRPDSLKVIYDQKRREVTFEDAQVNPVRPHDWVVIHGLGMFTLSKSLAPVDY